MITIIAIETTEFPFIQWPQKFHTDDAHLNLSRIWSGPTTKWQSIITLHSFSYCLEMTNKRQHITKIKLQWALESTKRNSFLGKFFTLRETLGPKLAAKPKMLQHEWQEWKEPWTNLHQETQDNQIMTYTASVWKLWGKNTDDSPMKEVELFTCNCDTEL